MAPATLPAGPLSPMMGGRGPLSHREKPYPLRKLYRGEGATGGLGGNRGAPGNVRIGWGGNRGWWVLAMGGLFGDNMSCLLALDSRI